MDDAVEMIEHTKYRPFGPPEPLREHGLPPSELAKARYQARDVGRRVLAIGVHDDDPFIRTPLLSLGDRTNAYAQRPLMSEIASKDERCDVINGRKAVRHQIGQR